MGAIPGLTLTWGGVDYRCRTTMDVIMRIEDEVTLSELAFRINDAALNNKAIPSSHCTWVMYCLLKGAGATVSKEAVWEAVKTGGVGQDVIIEVCKFIMAEVYGTGPDEPEDIVTEDAKKK